MPGSEPAPAAQEMTFIYGEECRFRSDLRGRIAPNRRATAQGWHGRSARWERMCSLLTGTRGRGVGKKESRRLQMINFSSFANSVWERCFAKLRFAGWTRRETEFPGSAFPNG